jgi:hypothetical protein
MRTRSRRRLGWLAAWALAVVVGGPELAHAQQGGLFPLAPIRRQRPPCALEDPVYKLYRHEYYGYHPTCWRRFPTGWGCPNPEAPNAAAEFKKLPRDVPSAEPGPDDEAMPGNEAMPGGAPGARPGANAPNPNALPPLPSGERSPFELDRPATPPPARGNPRGAEGPPPASEPGTPPVTPPGTNAPGDSGSAAAHDPHGDLPLLALPDPTVSPSPTSNSGSGAPAVNSSAFDPASAASPAQAPRRTSLIGGFFSSLRRR